MTQPTSPRPLSGTCAASRQKGLSMLDVAPMVDAVLDAIDKPLRTFAERLKAVEERLGATFERQR